MCKKPILSVRDLSVSFHMYERGFEQYDLKVISNLTLDVCPGEIVAIAGSSGSGKSLLAHAVMGLLPENASQTGDIFYNGRKLAKKDKETMRGKELALIPQSVAYLDPLMRVGAQVRGAHAPKEKGTMQKKIFKRLGLPPNTDNASVVSADEPTPGMDLASAAEALKIFRELADEGKAIVLITHDIDLAFHVADRIAVFYAGTTVEITDTKDFIKGPAALRHPYSKALWEALPQNWFKPIPGFQPYAGNLPKG